MGTEFKSLSQKRSYNLLYWSFLPLLFSLPLAMKSFLRLGQKHLFLLCIQSELSLTASNRNSYRGLNN